MEYPDSALCWTKLFLHADWCFSYFAIACACACICVCLCMCVCVCMCACVCACVHVCVHVCVCLHLFTLLHICNCVIVMVTCRRHHAMSVYAYTYTYRTARWSGVSPSSVRALHIAFLLHEILHNV